jgi:Flp pilus assembly pilin Flp
LTTRNEDGQATVELALCLPLVAIALAGLVQVGLLVGDQVRLWHAAREAARVGAVDADVEAMSAAAERGGLRDIDLAVRPRASHRVQGRPLTVSLEYAPAARVPVLGTLLSALDLRARATMRIEQP